MGVILKKIFNIRNLIFFLISLVIFSGTAIVFASPNLDNMIKKDLNVYLESLNKGNIKKYYEIYNTRRLTDLDKNRFYEKIQKAIDVVAEEKDVFLKHKLNVSIKEIDVVDKVNENIYLCNLKVNYKFRPDINKTETVQSTEDYLVKIIDIGNNDFKILLPFNSFDKDFSSSLFFKNLELFKKEKKALEREKKKEEEKLKEEQNGSKVEEDNSLSNDKIEDEVYIIKGDDSTLDINDELSSEDDEINQDETQSKNEINSDENKINNDKSLDSDT